MDHAHRTAPRNRMSRPTSEGQRDRRAVIAVLAVSTVVCGVISLVQSMGHGGRATAAPQVAAANGAAAPAAAGSVPPAAQAAPAQGGALPADTSVDGGAAAGEDEVGAEPGTDGSCTLTVRSLAIGDSGDNVACLQNALIRTGALSGAATGQFDQATFDAVHALQEKEDMFVDGKVGRETALHLGIWPDEQSLVIRTPKPPAGAKDLLGYPLSSVAVSGDDPNLPPLPANSGSGKRVVYDRAGQRVWAVDKNNRVVRSWLVAGSKYNNEVPGTHKVYSKSEVTTAWNGKATLKLMIRYYKTKIGNIGFHAIPIHRSDGTRYNTDAELGQRLSGGCQRQADLDAQFLWQFAQVGTTVVVT